jgi:hypothetical protein
MLTCRELVQQHSSDYIDKQLALRERAAVLFHLLLCGNCRLFIRQLRLLGGVLLARPPQPLDESTVQRLSGQLHALHAGSNRDSS